MKILEVEERLGISRQTLIYYEKEGFIHPQREQNNYRNYSEKDIEKLQTVLELRNMGISVENIKRIFHGDVSIKDILDQQQISLQKEKEKIEQLNESISHYLQKQKVYIAKDDDLSSEYANLFIKDDHLLIDRLKIKDDDICQIDISLCLSKGEQMYFQILNMYYVIIFINTREKCYKLELMNNNKVSYLFTELKKKHLLIDDPIGLIDIYEKCQDAHDLNHYINQHYPKWQKEYHLDEHIDNYYDVMKRNFIDPLQEAKTTKPTVRGEFKLLGQLYMQFFKKLFRIKS